MESSSKPETVPPGLVKKSVMSGSLPSDPVEKDSILTAARLARQGWTEEGTKTGWKFSYSDCPAGQPSVSKSDEIQGSKHAETCLKDARNRQVFIVNSRKTAEDREMDSEKKADKVKQAEGAFSANKQADRQTGLYGQAGIRVWVTRCRTTCRQSRRFKAPILPVISEI